METSAVGAGKQPCEHVVALFVPEKRQGFKGPAQGRDLLIHEAKAKAVAGEKKDYLLHAAPYPRSLVHPLESAMAFRKTSIGVTPPTPVDLAAPQVGDEKDGKVWDGEKWVVAESETPEPEPEGSQLPGA